MHILVTNDDGVFAPGLLALAKAMLPLGEVSVLAPDHNWSASGHVKTLDRPLRVKEIFLLEGLTAFASDGAPSDCVALAVMGYLKKPVDLIVSGINPTGNFGHDITYSGTVTAAMEGAISGLPSIAFSLDIHQNNQEPHFTDAAEIAAEIVKVVQANLLPDNVLLNVNIPDLPRSQIQGLMLTRLGLRVYRDELIQRTDPRHKPYYWIGGEAPTGVPEEGTDFGALAKDFVSVTPIHLDLTAYQALTTLKAWAWPEIKAGKP